MARDRFAPSIASPPRRLIQIGFCSNRAPVIWPLSEILSVCLASFAARKLASTTGASVRRYTVRWIQIRIRTARPR